MKEPQLAELERLQALRAAGALSPDEFEAEKRKLLAPPALPRTAWIAAVALGALVIAVALGYWLAPRPAPETVAPTPTPSIAAPIASPSPPRTEAQRLADAFAAATGRRAPFRETAGEDRFEVAPARLVDLPFGPALILTREIRDGCHACTGYLGVYYLQERDGRTAVTAAYPKAVSGWGWGAPPTAWQVTTRFTALPAIYASGGYTGQGITATSATITELTPAGPVGSDPIALGYTNGGAITDEREDERCEVTGIIGEIARDRGFTVANTGSVASRNRYVKRAGKFVPVVARELGASPCER